VGAAFSEERFERFNAREGVAGLGGEIIPGAAIG